MCAYCDVLGHYLRYLADANLFQVIADLFYAGSDTTSTSITWLLLYMIRNPDVQKRCREEIFQVGSNTSCIIIDISRCACLTQFVSILYLNIC